MLDNSTIKLIFEKALAKNLSEKEYNEILKFSSLIAKSIEETTQNYINEEIKEFKQMFPKAELKRTYLLKRNTIYGEIQLKVPEFRKAKFESLIIRKKARNFFLETFNLISLMFLGNITYQHISKYCKMLTLSCSNQEIANLVDIVEEIKQEDSNEE